MALKTANLPSIPEEIATAATTGELVVFVGAGLSMLIKCPSWTGFADRVLAQLVPDHIDHYVLSQINKIPDPRRRLSIANIVANRKKAKVDYSSIFAGERTPDDIYTFLNTFNCAFVTTNYEKYIAPELRKTDPEEEWRVFGTEKLLRGSLDDMGTVVHLHGCIDDPGTMIVTTKDYLEHYSKPEVREFLTYLFERKTVLFLGYGLAETEILEYILNRGGVQRTVVDGERKRFILQGFFTAEHSLKELLEEYYWDSFSTQLITFDRDEKDYHCQTDILSSWSKRLRFEPLTLSDVAISMMEEIDD